MTAPSALALVLLAAMLGLWVGLWLCEFSDRLLLRMRLQWLEAAHAILKEEGVTSVDLQIESSRTGCRAGASVFAHSDAELRWWQSLPALWRVLRHWCCPPTK